MRRELANLPSSTYLASASNDTLETGSISPSSVAPHHGEVIQQTAQNGWETKTTRYDAPPRVLPPKVLADNDQQDDDDLVTGSLRPIDMVPAPAPNSASVKTAAVDPTPPAPPAAATNGNYKVQLGAFRAPELAAQAWTEISRKNAALVASLTSTIQ